MEKIDKRATRRPYRSMALAAALLWTVGALLSLWWNLRNHDQTLLELARTTARVALEKDIVYREWSARYGGVYVPVTEVSPPNPYLAEHPERDVVTENGVRLTLMNPSYMNRQVHEMEKARSGVRGHLTSLIPIRPGNAADAWETAALRQFKGGSAEESDLARLEGREYMRLMRPVFAEETCLKCHRNQGYALGDMRGGLSISVPMKPIREAGREARLVIILWHLLTWSAGFAAIVLGAARLDRYYGKQELAERRILSSLAEKEVLLREIHHRVKNNLQVVSGLLDLQSTIAGDDAARAILKESRNRIMTMALIHQRLYQSGDLARIDMKEYLGRLAEDLFTAYGLDPDRLKLTVEADPVHLNLDTAIPCGLIVNELLVNSMKYAFPHRWVEDPANAGAGHISVELRALADDRYLLKVADDGVGIPDGFRVEAASTMGLKLVHSLVEQLSGSITTTSGPGVSYTMEFSPLPDAPGQIM